MKAFKDWIIAHKLLSIVIAAVVVVGAATAIVLPIALKHEHTFAAEWSQDGENHWHVCTPVRTAKKLPTKLHIHTITLAILLVTYAVQRERYLIIRRVTTINILICFYVMKT